MADPVFPLTIDDTSPIVLYTPFADTFAAPDTALGWNPFYTVSGFATVTSGAGSPVGPAVGNGTSLHITSCDNAALQIAWNGTDITLYGTLVLPQTDDSPDATYSVVLDGTATSNFLSHISKPSTVQDASTDVLVSLGPLSNEPHTLQLILHNPNDTDGVGNSTSGPIVVFDRAELNVGAGVPSPVTGPSQTSVSASSPTASTTASTAPVPDSAVAYRGEWDFETGLLPGSSAGFHTSTNVGDRATLVFNGSAVGLTGLATPDSGAYNVSLDQEQPVTVSARASFTSSSPTLLFFRTGLDPSVMHTIEVVNAGPSGAGDGAGSLLVLGAVNVTTIQSPGATPVGAASASAVLPRGAIAALVIGLTLAVAALVAAVIFFLRRRRRNSDRKRQMLVNPQIRRADRLSFLFPHRRRSEVGEQDVGKALEGGFVQGAVLDIRSPTPDAHEKEDSDESDDGEGESEGGHRLSAAEKGKQRALRRSNASKNSDGSYSIELPDLTIAQVPRGYLPASAVPSTPSPPRTLIPSPTSPRSPVKPKGPRELPGREPTRGILLSNLGSAPPLPAHPDEEGQLLAVAPSYLPEAHISPLRVEFASDVQDPEEGRTDRHISMGAMSLPQSLRQALSQHMASESSAPPSPTRPNRIYSFLDFSSTSTSLARSQRQSASNSNSTGKSRSSSRSKRNTGSENSHSAPSLNNVNWASLPPDRRISFGLSMTVGGAGTSRPSLSPNISLHPIPLSQSSPALPAIVTEQPTPPIPGTPSPEREGPDQQFPYDANQLPSPTDSVPYTVSDIHFRHSTHSSISMPTESRRTSGFRLSGSHRPPHPPLPSAGPSSPTRPTHHRGGSQTGSQSVPPFIVQRILGRAPGSTTASPYTTPTTPQFASMGTTAAAMRSTSSPDLAPHRGPRASAGGGPPAPGTPAQTTTPGSSTSVFGFQLGRHR